jgi:hypothetical protein
MSSKSKEKKINSVKTKDPKNVQKSTTTLKTKSISKDAEGKKAKSGYNIYMSQMMKKLKEEDEIDGRLRLKVVGERWRDLTQKEKDKFNDQAAEENEEEGREISKKAKSKSKYSAKSGETKKGKTSKKDDKNKDSTKEDVSENSD